MNKNIYRVIFNKARCMMMVVGEFVSSSARVSSRNSQQTHSSEVRLRCFAKLKTISGLTSLAIGLSGLFIPLAQADIIADSNAALSHQASITTTASGLPQVNIQTPNASGLSHNIYSRFDVHPQGVVLNNSRSIVQTQLGGLVLGNPNLATGTATIILNEVNASNPSQLRGFIEVAGDRAQVIVANPSGITCDGCGFINANRATLSTGTPVVNGGNLESYVVRRGTISFEGDGLDSRQTNYTDVIARAVKINASVFANDLRITTGANRVNVDNSQTQKIEGSGSQPVVSIDVSELGGMYAGKIRLIATEKGVGVRNTGIIGASAGNIQLTADGRLINSGQITATANINIESSDDIENNGVIAASEILTINSTAQLRNTGNAALYADDIELTANEIENSKSNDVAAVMAARETLTITAQQLTNRDGAIIYSGNDIDITAGTINNNSALIDAVKNITMTADTINNTNENFQTRLVQAESVSIQEFALVGSANRYRPDQVTLRPDRNDDVNFLVTPEGEDDAYNQFDYIRRVEQTEIVESDPAQISAGGDIYITAATVVNENSRVIAGGDLTADIDTLSNTETAGQRITRENGTITTFSRRNRKGRDKTKVRVSAYNPAPAIQSVNLNQAAFAGGTRVTNSTTEVPLLSNGLFRQAPNTSAGYLIETDPRFTNQRLFLSSDFVLNQLAFSPTLTQKRLGDGFYEQQLVREQLAQLTGRRFLDGFADDETQYRALLNAGITAVTEFELQPGIALSAEQIAQLTSDVVLLVEQEVTLGDGTVTRALVPQLYVRLQEGDINANGGLLSATNITINSGDDLVNSASIAGRQLVTLNADNIQIKGGLVTATVTTVTANKNVNVEGGTLEAKESLTITAENDLNVSSTLSTQANSQGQRTNINRVATLFVSDSNAVLLANAGNNINIDGARISNTGDNGRTELSATKSINLATVTESLQQASIRDASNFRKETSRDEVGTRISTKGSVTLIAGADINARAVNITSEESEITLLATNDISLNEGRSKRTLDEGLKTKSKGFLSSTIKTRRNKISEDNSSGSVISAEQVTMQSGNNINIVASDVVATNNVDFTAQGKVNIREALDTRLELNLREKKKSGIFSSSGFGLTIGTQQLNTNTRVQVASASGSTLGSTDGNVSVSASDYFRQTASKIVAAKGDISIHAKDIRIESAENIAETVTETKFKQSGLSVSISNPVLSSLQTIKRVNTARKRIKDSRLKKLATTTKVLAALKGYEAIESRLDKVARDAIDSGNEAAKDTNTGNEARDSASDTSTLVDKTGGINLNISLGSLKRQSKSTQTNVTAASSRVSAGNNVILNATGDHGDIAVKASQVSATNNIVLQAQQNIDLVAARNRATLKSKNSSSSSSVGGSIGTNGPSLNASISKGRGYSNGDDITFTSTRLRAGKGVGLISGQDTQLTGAVIDAEQVVVNVGGDLTIASLQETSTYQSKQATQGLSASVSIGAGIVSGSVNSNQSKVNADFTSVIEQSGILAGDEGFQINVQGNTNLVGAIVASSEQAEQEGKNEFITGTLVTSDLENNEEVTASQTGLSLSSGKLGKYKIAKAAISNLATNTDLASDQQSTTLSGIGTNNIQINDAEQQQTLTGESAETTIANLNKDVSTGNNNNALVKTDAKQIEIELQATTTIKQEFSKQVIAITDDAYKALFLRKPKFYKVTCPAGENCTKNPQRAITTLVTAEEVAKNGSKETVIAVNGIFNGLERAGELAYQNAKNIDQTTENPDGRKPDTIYLLHYVPANGRIAEFLVTGYEKLLTQSDYETGKSLGYSNVDIAYAEVLRARGNKDTESLGHSRGTQVQANAFKILGNQADVQGNTYENDKLTVRSLGAATNIMNLAKIAQGLKVKDRNIKASVFSNDTVPALFAGVDRTASIGELLSNLIDSIFTSNSAHSCYGTGTIGCKDIEIPLINGPKLAKGAKNLRLLKFENGELLQKNGLQNKQGIK